MNARNNGMRGLGVLIGNGAVETRVERAARERTHRDGRGLADRGEVGACLGVDLVCLSFARSCCGKTENEIMWYIS